MNDKRYLDALVPKRFAELLPNPSEKDITGDKTIAYVHWAASVVAEYETEVYRHWFATGYDPQTKTYHGLICGFETKHYEAELEFGCWTIEQFENVNGLFGMNIIELDTHWIPQSIAPIRKMYT